MTAIAAAKRERCGNKDRTLLALPTIRPVLAPARRFGRIATTGYPCCLEQATALINGAPSKGRRRDERVVRDDHDAAGSTSSRVANIIQVGRWIVQRDVLATAV